MRHPLHGVRASARSYSARERTGSLCETITYSKGNSSNARSAGSARFSYDGDFQMRNSPAGRRQRIRKNNDVLLGQPKRRLVAASSVVERDEASRKLAARLDELQLGLGNVPAKEEARAETAGVVAAHQLVDVAHVIRLEHDGCGRRTLVEALRHLDGISGRSEWIENEHLAA